MTESKITAQTAPGVDRIELMQTFIRIVETGSLSAAAARLGTTQPTISRRLQALERFLGLRLLQRTTHVMKLTEDGERCYARARDLLDNWRAMEEDLRGVADEPEGTLRVLVPHAFGQRQLMPLLADYLARYPKVSVEWLLQDRRPDFVAEGIDCALHVGEVGDVELVASRVSEIPRIVVAAPALAATVAEARHPGDLAGLPWAALRTFYRDAVTLRHDADRTEYRLPIQPRVLTDNLYALHNAALLGMGAAVESAWMTTEDIKAGRLCQLIPAWQADPLPIYLMHPYARYYPARLRRFLELVRQAMPAVMDGAALIPSA
ncbi:MULTISPECIES: LysR family transcriptional regulator [unclassified Achromobacter]|uniref:LysR family transcriptional regulator n=1 Tax=unclassified Achromobacter TaxID=2626865 RepID=UPI000B5169FD|nr:MULTISPECIES: LysR family transcriptional regulator [unclassified Achromobacter]OWT73023.1 LysR family transcriptional regulator [Achromobacter sp. HZ34]OWT74241.1 LysR family transcriptional regulator [Achromobacter sp. HZ28]